jgi:F-type H+-transporting ATPase subunit gamma
MPSLIDIRRRIRSVKNTQQLTKALKMVSAAKLRRAQERVLGARPYARSLEEMLGSVAQAAGSDENAGSNALLARREEKKIQLVVFTSDRGQAGAFNANLLRMALSFVEEHKGKALDVEAVGRKGRDYFRRRNVNISGEHLGVSNKPDYAQAKAIAKTLIERYETGEVDSVYIAVNEFKSVIATNVQLRKLLPIELPEATAASVTAGTDGAKDYIFEEPPAVVLNMLLPKYVEVAIWQAILESTAAEHAARMTAMDAASSNAGAVIEKLTLYMNRVRQASITREIIEIVSGASALE